MSDNERKFKLDFIRDKIIKELLFAPICNDRFSATFNKKSSYSGDVIFKDNQSEKVKKATWSTSKTTDTIIVTLFENNGFVVCEEDYDKFIDRVRNRLVMC